MSTLRLTLRTLLAYLDDTLDPAEIKSIGEKVKESKTAQELIDRIKKLVRKRRLTTPPFTGPEARFDANTIAEYLDNELSSKTVNELEDFCREENAAADLYLAEVASAHQILALVLGEPMMVPATAKQRMYGLVKGREAIPYRKPPSTTQTPQLAASHSDMDADERSPLLGLTARKHPWVVWAIPFLAVLLLVGAGLALYLALPQLTDEPSRSRNGGQYVAVDKDRTAKDREATRDGVKPKDLEPVKDREVTKDSTPTKDGIVKDGQANPKDAPSKDGEPKPKDSTVKDGPPPDPMPMPMPMPTPVVYEPPGKASTVKANVATYSFDPQKPTVLVQKTEDKGWVRLPIGANVTSSEPLVALPGSACKVKTAGGIHLLLRGFLPQYSLPQVEVTTRLLDCAVTLHQNSKAAADLTLHRGRLRIGNEKAPARVIVRFGKEAWVITFLEPNSEVGIDLVTRYTAQTNYLDGEEPLTEVYLLMLKGRVDLRVDTFEFPNMVPPPGQAFYAWTNKGPRMLAPAPVPVEALKFWDLAPPATQIAQAMEKAIETLAKQTTGSKPLITVLKEMRSGSALPERLLAIYSLSAIDQTTELLNALGDEDPNHLVERDEATFALRRWMSRDAKHNLALYNPKTQTGILVDEGYKTREAEALQSLLHGLNNPADQADDLKTKLAALLAYMRNDRITIRHVAHYLFDALTASIANKPAYNAAFPPEIREAAVAKLQDLLNSGALTAPPVPAQPMPPKP